jgi:hypothetical protein
MRPDAEVAEGDGSGKSALPDRQPAVLPPFMVTTETVYCIHRHLDIAYKNRWSQHMSIRDEL